MPRAAVQVVRIRFIDLVVGDIANRDPNSSEGWFVINELRELANGEISATNTASRHSLTGFQHDLVGIQVQRKADPGGPPSSS